MEKMDEKWYYKDTTTTVEKPRERMKHKIVEKYRSES